MGFNNRIMEQDIWPLGSGRAASNSLAPESVLVEKYLDASLEYEARELEEKIAKLEQRPNSDDLARVVHALRAFKLHAMSALDTYGSNYENGGQHFIDLAKRAVAAAKKVPESITQDEEGRDRSAHAALYRHQREITTHIKKVCGNK